MLSHKVCAHDVGERNSTSNNHNSHQKDEFEQEIRNLEAAGIPKRKEIVDVVTGSAICAGAS